MNRPTFSAVVPAYNARSTIASTIGSILKQTRDDWELIVADDGSTDDTVNTVDRFSGGERVRCVRQENQGPGAARNLGIEHARGRYISFLDSDDLWMPTYLDQMGQALEANPGAGLAYADAYSFNDRTKRIYRETAMEYARPPATPPTDHTQLLLRLVSNNFIHTSATVRRDVVNEVGRFDTSLPRVQDYDLWLRIVTAGYQVARAPGLLAIQRDREGSLSKGELIVTECLARVMRSVAENADLPEQVRREAAERLRNLDRKAAALSGQNKVLGGAYWLRRLAVRAKGSVLPPPSFKSPPPEVLEAFPDLRDI